MSEDNANSNNGDGNGTPTTPGNANPANVTTTDQNQGTETISKESFNVVSEKYKQAKADKEALEAKLAEIDRKKLEEDGKYKDLYEKEKQAKDELETKLTRSQKGTAFRVKAIQAGVVNPDDALKLVDIDKISLKDGEVEGVDDLIKSLQENKPYLFQKDNKINLGSGTNPQASDTPTFTLEQIQDHSFYKEHEKEILQAAKEGKIK